MLWGAATFSSFADMCNRPENIAKGTPRLDVASDECDAESETSLASFLLSGDYRHLDDNRLKELGDRLIISIIATSILLFSGIWTLA